ncbi:SDR family NAD(P)-dependent oxidoreductase [Streptomyces sp. NPDC059352]|uniref:SDR family NAD(P)-dependent oxidoreductase n=1 Tax=Streptomyces sp. NPDC059352 TaxID=3346810 RepID=UPI00369C7491
MQKLHPLPDSAPDEPGPVWVVGASSGFGFALAQDLARGGQAVTGLARSEPPADAEFTYRRADVTDPAGFDHAMDALLDAHGAPGGLVYCPSNTAAVGRSWELDTADLQDLFEVTYLGFVRAVRRAVPAMIEAGRGSIVLVGSRAARIPVETLAGYASAKAAAEQYAQCLARELEPTGVRVNVIGISADTPLAREHLRLRAATLGREEPYPALPSVLDNLGLARFLLTPDAGFITGQTIEARQPLWV